MSSATLKDVGTKNNFSSTRMTESCILGKREIPYDELLNMTPFDETGDYYTSNYKNQKFLVKKVHSKEETEVLHLLELSHPNLIKFLYALFLILMEFFNIIFFQPVFEEFYNNSFVTVTF